MAFKFLKFLNLQLLRPLNPILIWPIRFTVFGTAEVESRILFYLFFLIFFFFFLKSFMERRTLSIQTEQ